MADSEDNPERKLDSMFHEGLDLYNKICTSNADTSSVEMQRDILTLIELLQKATRLVSLADIFSSNETIEELATNDIKYLLLPALLGMVTLKKKSNGPAGRKQVIDTAEIYFIDFLQRTNCYGLSKYEFKNKEEKDDKKNAPKKTDLQLLADAVNTRSNKIKKFEEQVELQCKLKALKEIAKNEHADEEVKRKYFLTMIKSFIYEVTDELPSIETEKQILEHMVKLQDDGNDKKTKVPPPLPKSLQPFIITRNDVQKAIYGAGYPSLPTMTVQEFYDKRVADGVFPDPQKPAADTNSEISLQAAALAGVSLNNEELEQEELENKIETDNEEYLNKMRSQDEFKDQHRRGWGNRMNRS